MCANTTKLHRDKFKCAPKWIEYILLFPCGNICVSVHQQPWPGHPFKCNYSAAHARLATREARAVKDSIVSGSLQIDLPYYCWECYGKFKVTCAIFRHEDQKYLESTCFAYLLLWPQPPGPCKKEKEKKKSGLGHEWLV